MASLHSNRGAKRARDARDALGFTREGPLPDVVHAVEEFGGAHVIVLELPDGVAGAYSARPGCPLLFVNGRQALARQRFTVAHEFGHARMGHESRVDRQAVISGYDHDPVEVEANAFAAEFLMPRDAMRAWGANHDGPVTLEDVVALAVEYGVSAQAIRYALEGAGVLADTRRCDQLDAEIAEEAHVEVFERLGLEPITDELADAAALLPRLPPALRGTALGDYVSGAIDSDALARALDAAPETVAAMLAAFGLDSIAAMTTAAR